MFKHRTHRLFCYLSRSGSDCYLGLRFAFRHELLDSCFYYLANYKS